MKRFRGFVGFGFPQRSFRDFEEVSGLPGKVFGLLSGGFKVFEGSLEGFLVSLWWSFLGEV